MIAALASAPPRPVRAAAVALLSLLYAAPINGARPAHEALAAPPDPWIHVRVVEGDGDAATVEVHLPLSAVRLGLDLAAKETIVDGRLKLRNSEVDVADLRRMWQELRAAGDAEFVTIEDEDGTVHVRRAGDRVEVRVSRVKEGGEEVLVDVPVALVDVLLAGEAGTLDLAGAIAQLGDFRGDLVRVREGARSVRVWVDDRPAPAGRQDTGAAPAEAPKRKLPRVSGGPA